MNEIGGYFELECGRGSFYHKDAYLLNSGCSALRLAIRTYKITELYVPEYTCPVVWEAVAAENCKCLFYKVELDFLPQQNFPKQAYVLYNNYFGICSKQVRQMTEQYPNLIVDNAQAFYMPPVGLASFYSPRKFFGVPDGGLLMTKAQVTLPDTVSDSWKRCSHLLKRRDLGASAAYADFKENEAALEAEGICRMSQLTQALFGNIDCEDVRRKRLANFFTLHQTLKGSNQLALELAEIDVPLVYPYLIPHGSELKKKLIAEKIYCPTYWPESNVEIFSNLVSLPIDQRYNQNDMKYILHVIGN